MTMSMINKLGKRSSKTQTPKEDAPMTKKKASEQARNKVQHEPANNIGLNPEDYDSNPFGNLMCLLCQQPVAKMNQSFENGLRVHLLSGRGSKQHATAHKEKYGDDGCQFNQEEFDSNIHLIAGRHQMILTWLARTLMANQDKTILNKYTFRTGESTIYCMMCPKVLECKEICDRFNKTHLGTCQDIAKQNNWNVYKAVKTGPVVMVRNWTRNQPKILLNYDGATISDMLNLPMQCILDHDVKFDVGHYFCEDMILSLKKESYFFCNHPSKMATIPPDSKFGDGKPIKIIECIAKYLTSNKTTIIDIIEGTYNYCGFTTIQGNRYEIFFGGKKARKKHLLLDFVIPEALQQSADIDNLKGLSSEEVLTLLKEYCKHQANKDPRLNTLQQDYKFDYINHTFIVSYDKVKSPDLENVHQYYSHHHNIHHHFETNEQSVINQYDGLYHIEQWHQDS